MKRRGQFPAYLQSVILGLLAVLQVSTSLNIIDIKGPSVVMNGSVPLLVLDCDYHVTELEKPGLVVKWYYNRQPFPVYQWIPSNGPQDLGILKDRLDLNYAVSNEEHMKHRALAIMNPTSELTGEYTCWISTFESEAYSRKKLIIYSPAVDMSMTYTKPNEESVIITCRAGGIFPAPDITIFRSSSTSRRSVIEDAKVDTRYIAEYKSYNVSIELEMFDYELDSKTMFECVLRIPDTKYEVREEILYFPGVPVLKTSVSGAETVSCSILATVLIHMALLFRL